MDKPEILCPHCLLAVGVDRKCPRCGQTADLGAWPTIRGLEDYSPCTSHGLLAPEIPGGPYRVPSCRSSEAVKGTLLTPLPYDFKNGKPSIIFGGSALTADIIIEGLVPVQTVLLQNRNTRNWWVWNIGDSGMTSVNGETVRLHELQNGDRIVIAGQIFAFRGNRLESARLSVEGLSLSVRNMTFTVPGRENPILDRVSFAVKSGEFVGILGASGCGKSSLVQRIIGLSDDFRGEVLVNGHDRRMVENAFRASAAYLPQNVDQSLHDSLTLADEIDCFRQLHLQPTPSDTYENEEVLATLGLSGKENSVVGTLSGGEKRRLGIALALLRKPRLMLLDEPGAGLDPASEWTLMRHLRGIANQGRTVLCVTHVLTHADLFDKVLVLSRGRIAYYGPPAGVMEAFKIRDWSELYQLLAAGDIRPHVEREPEDLTKTDISNGASQASLRQVISGYLSRFRKEFLGRQSWLTAQPLVLWFWQPLGLVLGLRIACAYCFQSDGDGQPVNNAEMLGFCASLSVFWTGINNSAREFVRERVPGRCLERLNGVSYFGYLISRLVWMLTMCVIATASFTLLLCIAGRIPVPMTSDYANVLSINPMCFFPLAVTSVIGGLCGMAVSAVAKKEIGAVSIVPNVAILALLFSNQVVRFDFGDGYVKFAKVIAEVFMPCHWPAKIFDQLHSSDPVTDFGYLLVQFAAYLAICGSLIGYFQKRHEEDWNGR